MDQTEQDYCDDVAKLLPCELHRGCYTDDNGVAHHRSSCPSRYHSAVIRRLRSDGLEIERLQLELEDSRKCSDLWADDCARLKAEIERLQKQNAWKYQRIVELKKQESAYLAACAESNTLPDCAHCGVNKAACFGAYEGREIAQYACNECCGHGCEDGRCVQIADMGAEIAQLKAQLDDVTIDRNRWREDSIRQTMTINRMAAAAEDRNEVDVAREQLHQAQLDEWKAKAGIYER